MTAKKYILLFLLIWPVILLPAQAPHAFQYQTIIRNNWQQPLTNTFVAMRFSILEAAVDGPALYVEEHGLTTDSRGWVSLAIGTGTAIQGSMETIPWGDGVFFLKVEADESGQGNYREMGVSQLLSVPFALYANTADNGFSGQYNDLSGKPDFSGWDQNVSNDFDGRYSSLRGAPLYLSAFVNDVAFLTETDFEGWDKDVTDDFSGNFADLLNIPAGLSDGDNDTHLTEAQVETYIENAPVSLASGSTVNGKVINDWNDLINVPADIADGDDVLSEAMVDAYVSDNGYLTKEKDGSITNEWQNLSEVLTKGNDLGNLQLKNLGEPETDIDAATKQYTDALLAQIENLELLLARAHLMDKGSFTDPRDNHVYPWLRFGEQVWMGSNLAWLPEVSPSSEKSNTDPFYYVYDYQGTDVAQAKATNQFKTYGALYNYSAALNACPEGWHLPSVNEYTTLINYLISKGYNYDGSFVGNKIGKALSTDYGWEYTSYIGVVGNIDYPLKRNATGYSALPSGNRNTAGNFIYAGYDGYWWTHSPVSETQSYGYYLTFYYIDLKQGVSYNEEGFAVRCIRD